MKLKANTDYHDMYSKVLSLTYSRYLLHVQKQDHLSKEKELKKFIGKKQKHNNSKGDTKFNVED